MVHSCGFFPYSLHSKICLSLGTSLRQSSVMLEIKAGPGKKNNEKTHEILKYEIAIFFWERVQWLETYFYKMYHFKTFTKCITLKNECLLICLILQSDIEIKLIYLLLLRREQLAYDLFHEENVPLFHVGVLVHHLNPNLDLYNVKKNHGH